MRKSNIAIALLTMLVLTSCSVEEERDESAKPGISPREGNDTSAVTHDSLSDRPAIDDRRLIVPGVRIGQTRIGESLQAVNSILGRPDSGDAAMGHVWEYRRSPNRDGGRPHELDIYATFDSEATGHYVRQIRITSPWFITREGIGTGGSFDSIKRSYPNIQPIAEYEEEGVKHVVYDDLRKGIAFEFIRGKDGVPEGCTGIIVHEMGRDVRQTYIPRREYRELWLQDSIDSGERA